MAVMKGKIYETNVAAAFSLHWKDFALFQHTQR